MTIKQALKLFPEAHKRVIDHKYRVYPLHPCVEALTVLAKAYYDLVGPSGTVEKKVEEKGKSFGEIIERVEDLEDALKRLVEDVRRIQYPDPDDVGRVG